MGKTPAFLFYPGDWLKDPQLRMTSFATQGVWMKLLCHMWEAPDRGVLQGDDESFQVLIGCSKRIWTRFVSDAVRFNFCNLTRHEIGSKTNRVEYDISIASRRMQREENQRKQACMRQARHRSHANVTIPSSVTVTSSVTEAERRSTPTLDSVVNLDLDLGNGVGVGREQLAAQVLGDPPPAAKDGKPKPKKAEWPADEQELVDLLKSQQVFPFELLDHPDWWLNLADVLGGEINLNWVETQFKAMQSKFLLGYPKPLANRRRALGFIGAWLRHARENERRVEKWAVRNIPANQVRH